MQGDNQAIVSELQNFPSSTTNEMMEEKLKTFKKMTDDVKEVCTAHIHVYLCMYVQGYKIAIECAQLVVLLPISVSITHRHIENMCKCIYSYRFNDFQFKVTNKLIGFDATVNITCTKRTGG